MFAAFKKIVEIAVRLADAKLQIILKRRKY